MSVQWPRGREAPEVSRSVEEPPRAGPSPMDLALFVAGALWRRRLVVAAVILTSLVSLVVYYRRAVPLYRVETRLLAQRQQALPSIGRPIAQDDAPTRAVWDVVHRRENLLALIEAAGLLQKPPVASAGKDLKEGLAGLLGRSGATGNPEGDLLQAMVTRLDRALLVTTTEATITISIDWPEPEQAYRLVETALQNFLEARHIQEVTAMDEGISLLQGRVAALREQLDLAVAEARSDASRRGAGRPAAAPRPQSEELAQLRSMLEAKERAVADVEEFRRRRHSELQAQLDAAKAVYSDAHPNVMALRQDIAGLGAESPQVVGLREEIRRLKAEYQARGGGEAAAPRPAAAVQEAPTGPELAQAMESEGVRQARYRYQQMVDRVGAAQMDLDAARSSFKYRYTVVWPAELPRKPVSPSAVKILGAGGLAAVLLAVLIALGLELRAGRALARWQVEQSLGLPVLGEVEGRD